MTLNLRTPSAASRLFHQLLLLGLEVQPFTSCCLLQKNRLDPRVLQKHLAISPIPLPFVAAL
jgi:hypothetical protein